MSQLASDAVYSFILYQLHPSLWYALPLLAPALITLPPPPGTCAPPSALLPVAVLFYAYNFHRTLPQGCGMAPPEPEPREDEFGANAVVRLKPQLVISQHK